MNSKEEIKPENYQLFPKRLSYIALIISFGVFLGQTFTMYKNVKEFERINKEEIPLLEMSAINIRLNQEIFNKLQLAIIDKENRKLHIEQIESFSGALDYNIGEFLSHTKLENSEKKRYLREKLFKIENEVISALKAGQLSKAKRIYQGTLYQNYFFEFTDRIQAFIEKLALNREKNIAKKEMELIGITVALMFVFILMIALWIYVYRGYSKNLELKDILEKDLADQRALAFNSSKLASLGEMAAGIAHEINNPLTIISGSVFKLNRRFKKLELEDKELDTSLQKISDTILRIADIVKSMRTISRDGADDDYVMVNLCEIINEGVILISEKIKISSVDLDVEIENNSYEVYGKATQIAQILMNLISNSLDALNDISVDKKVLRVEVNSNDDHIILSITDNAGGIPLDIAEKIFNPFFTTKDIGKGTGLGLSLSKSIMENHGGELKLSQKDGLTTFSLFFPKDITNIEVNKANEAA